MQNTSSVSAFDLTDAHFSGVLSDIELSCFLFCFFPHTEEYSCTNRINHSTVNAYFHPSSL